MLCWFALVVMSGSAAAGTVEHHLIQAVWL